MSTPPPQNCWYAGFYVGAVPRLDLNNVLPRCEFIILPVEISEEVFPGGEVATHLLKQLLIVLTTARFDVSADHHSKLQDLLKIDILLPSLLIRPHETVEIWASELAARVKDYIRFYISRNSPVEESAAAPMLARVWRGAARRSKWAIFG
jgi:hypothetical protein